MKEIATLAGGCFWCIEHAFAHEKGILSVTSGYSGGQKEKPSYEEVSSGKTGHYEAVQVVFDPNLINYTKLLDIFWHQIDPTDAGGQFADRGTQYQTAIFYHDDKQKNEAEASKKKLEASGKFARPIATKILPAAAFYPAEDYHQQYYKKCPLHYNTYSTFSGRSQYIEDTWKDDDKGR